jgi:beta-barrel assembly-enhancing protease
MAAALLLLVLSRGTASETTISPPPNDFSPAEDVALGQEAAREVARHLTFLDDPVVSPYLQALGARLVGTIPASLHHAAFAYSFRMANRPDLTSFSLPGGPIVVSRGMVEAVRSEGELAGLLAHQIAHVALRHATAQVTRGERFQVGGITGRAIGAAAAGAEGDIFALGARFGVRTYFLEYDPWAELQADHLGAALLARSGYNPRDLAAMFLTVETEGPGRGAWQWAQSHPDPNDGEEQFSHRAYVARHADSLGVAKSTARPGEFDLVRIRLQGLPLGQRREDTVRARQRGTPAYGVGVAAPSGVSRFVMAGDALRVAVPGNWRRSVSGNTIIVAPDHPTMPSPDGLLTFTHGAQIGVARSTTGGLQGDTQALMQGLRRRDTVLLWAAVYQDTVIGEHAGITAALSNVSVVTGEREYVSVSATHVPDGSLLYVIGIAPEHHASTYRRAIERVVASIQLVD